MLWEGWVRGEEVLGSRKDDFGRQRRMLSMVLASEMRNRAGKALPYGYFPLPSLTGRQSAARGAPSGAGSHLCTPAEVPAPVLGYCNRVRSLVRTYMCLKPSFAQMSPAWYVCTCCSWGCCQFKAEFTLLPRTSLPSVIRGCH